MLDYNLFQDKQASSNTSWDVQSLAHSTLHVTDISKCGDSMYHLCFISYFKLNNFPIISPASISEISNEKFVSKVPLLADSHSM